MAVSFGSIGARTNKAAVAATDTITPALPSGVAAGDRLIIFASSLRDATTFSADQSYVKTRQNTKIAILEKNAGSSEVAPTVTFGGLTVGDLISAVILRFPGGTDTKDWSNVTGASSATSMPGPALTVTDAGSVGVVIGYQPNDKTGATFTANGWTEREYSTTTTGTDGTHYVATQDGLASGAQTMPSWAWSGGLEYRAISFSVPPASSGAVFDQAVTVASSASVSVGRSLAKLVAATVAGALIGSRGVAHAVPLAVGTSIAAVRGIGKAVSAIAASGIAVAASRAFLVAVNVSVAAIVAVSRRMSHTVTAEATSTVSVAKAVGRLVATSVLLTVTLGRALRVTIEIGVAGTVALSRAMGRSVSLVGTTVIGLSKASALSLSSSVASLIVVARQIGGGVFEFGLRVARAVAEVRALLLGGQQRSVAASSETRSVSVPAERRIVVAVDEDRNTETITGVRSVRPEDE